MASTSHSITHDLRLELHEIMTPRGPTGMNHTLLGLFLVPVTESLVCIGEGRHPLHYHLIS